MISATISATKNRLSELLVRVRAGETLIIVDRKTPVARVERIREITDNPHLLSAREQWDPKKVLGLPIFRAKRSGPGLVDAVLEERESGR